MVEQFPTPLVRKGVRDAISDMIQRTEEVRAHRLSWRGLRWTVEAWRRDLSFAEVVLLHTQIYIVEQVFLIHRESSLLLEHVTAPGIPPPIREPDIAADLLMAIRDFVGDCFRASENEEFDMLKRGDVTIWTEPGPLAWMAAVVRGFAPEQELRHVFQDALVKIHQEQHDQLRRFAGDTKPFAAVRPHLRSCLRCTV